MEVISLSINDFVKVNLAIDKMVEQWLDDYPCVCCRLGESKRCERGCKETLGIWGEVIASVYL